MSNHALDALAEAITNAQRYPKLVAVPQADPGPLPVTDLAVGEAITARYEHAYRAGLTQGHEFGYTETDARVFASGYALAAITAHDRSA